MQPVPGQNKSLSGYAELREVSSNQYGVTRAELADIVNKVQQRKFTEEVDHFESKGGDTWLIGSIQADLKHGVKQAEFEERVSIFGSNKKKEKELKGFWELMWEALEDTTLRILLVSSIVSIIIDMATAEEGHLATAWIEGFAIFVAVMICATVTAGNNYNQERQFRSLYDEANSRKLVSVWRDGVIHSKGGEELCVGDVVKLTEGMEIPADGYIIEGHEVTTDESAMTGETDPIKKASLSECIRKRETVKKEVRNIAEAGHHAVPSPILLSGTRVLTGEGLFVVIVVGELSCVGRIQDKLDQETEPTPLQEKLESIADDIGKWGLRAAIAIVIVLLIRFAIERIGNPWDRKYWAELLKFLILGITVVVVAIPEGLPLAVTLSLAYSVKKMLSDNNLVRRMEACETMGGAQVICSDKTGTLTQNKMTLTTMWNETEVPIKVYETKTVDEYWPKHCQDLLITGLCNSSATLEPLTGSKTEIAFLQFLKDRCGFDVETYRNGLDVTDKFPFSSQRKRMSTVYRGKDGKRILHQKGASEIVLEQCSHFYSWKNNRVEEMTPVIRSQIEKAIENMANQALRTICLGYKEIRQNDDMTTKDDKNVFEIEKRGLICLGIFGIKDILRAEVPPAIAKCNNAGITVKMVTGDNKMTARAIAKECGIAHDDSLVMEGMEFMKLVGGVVCKNCKTRDCDCPRDKETAEETKKPIRVDTILNGAEFDKIYEKLAVLARSRPEDKYALVTGLKERGKVVAVTGDGTNDAPALKKADVGFAMGIAGTEVAREASSIILLDDNFNSIVQAVKWGRNIYDSIRKFIQFQLTVNVVAVVCTLIGAAVLQQSVLEAIQMLWVNLIMDTLASLALATEPPTDALLDRKPHDREEYIVSKRMFKHIFGQAFYQLTILMVIVFAGEWFIPELPEDESKSIFTNKADPRYIRSGRMKHISGGADYEELYKTAGPSRHFTVVFATFVALQVFNFLNSRKLSDEFWVFEGITDSPLFIAIVIFICVLQFVLTMFGSIAFNCHKQGLTPKQWAIAVIFGAGSLVWSALLKLVTKEGIFPQFGNQRFNPLTHTRSLALKLKKAKAPLWERKTSAVTSSNMMPGFKSVVVSALKKVNTAKN